LLVANPGSVHECCDADDGCMNADGKIMRGCRFAVACLGSVSGDWGAAGYAAMARQQQDVGRHACRAVLWGRPPGEVGAAGLRSGHANEAVFDRFEGR
jgi:hypothetical protein